MAFTRKLLKSFGIEADTIDAIIDEHVAIVDSLKKDAEELRTKANDLQTQLTEAQSKLGEGNYKDQYEALKKEFDTYKTDIESRNTTKTKEDALRKLLSDIKVSDKRINSILKVSDLSSIELDDDGSIKDADKLKSSLTEEWGDFIVTEHEKGADENHPPGNSGGGTFEAMSLYDKMQYVNANPDSEEAKSWLNK